MNLWSDAFSGKNILITGGAGYLASTLVSLLQDIDCRVVRLDRQQAGRTLTGGAAQVVDACGDIRDPEVWERHLEDVDVVFHFAAQTSTYVANGDPVADHAANVLPMLHLLEACRRTDRCPTVCFSSTVTIAGIPLRLPVDETHPDHPLTMYDLHKQMAEQYLRRYSEEGVIRGISLRLANVYGPGPKSSNADRGVLNQMIRRAIAGEPLTVYGKGHHVRDYVYVEDVARAFIAAAVNGEALSGGTFVIGSGKGFTIAEAMQLIAQRCRARSGIRVEIRHIDPPESLSPIENRDFVGDSSAFRGQTGWEPLCSLSEGIDRTLEALS